MTYYYYISSNVEIENKYLEKFRFNMKESFVGSKYKIQFELPYNPSKKMLKNVYNELSMDVLNNSKYDYIVVEVAHALSAYGTPFKVDKTSKYLYEEFKVEHLINLEEDEMICIERKKWLEREKL